MNKKESGISDIELIRYLDHCIDEELSKPVDDQDMELIEKYNAVIEKLQPDTYKPDPAVKAQQLKVLCDRSKYGRKSNIRFVHKFNKVAAAALIAVASVTSLTVVTCAVSNKTPIQLIQDFGNKIFGINPGESVDVGNMTLIRSNGESVKYASLEEAIKAEGLDIYYPTWLPDGVRIESVYVNETTDGCEVLFMFDSDSVSMSIKCGKDDESYTLDQGYTENNINGINVYALNFGREIFTKFNLDGDEYSIRLENADDIDEIIKGLLKG